MTSATDQTGQGRDLLSAVALLRDLPERGLVRGQVGTIVEPLDEASALVEFSDDEGRAYAIVPCPREALLILRINEVKTGVSPLSRWLSRWVTRCCATRRHAVDSNLNLGRRLLARWTRAGKLWKPCSHLTLIDISQ
jgi:Domain of unknown function (DUF4926)